MIHTATLSAPPRRVEGPSHMHGEAVTCCSWEIIVLPAVESDVRLYPITKLKQGSESR